MEAIASVFATDVPRLALLVLPPGSSVQKSISELQDLGVDARPLDLRSRVIDQLGQNESSGEEDPVLLVATPATIRGVDLPQLTHVFLAGAPDTSSTDVFKHVAGRVGRFGREGKVVPFSSALRSLSISIIILTLVFVGDDLCDGTRGGASRGTCAYYEEPTGTSQGVLPQAADKA